MSNNGVCSEDHPLLQPANVTVTRAEEIGNAVTAVVLLAWITANEVYFLTQKNKYARTKVRVGLFNFSYYLAQAFYVIGWMVPVAIGWQRYPCWLSWVCTAMSMAFFNATNFTRNSTFMLMTGLSYATEANGRISLDRIDAEEEAQAKMSPTQRLREYAKMLFYGLNFVFYPNAVKSAKSKEEHMKMLVALRFITSWTGSCLFTLCVLFPYLITIVVVCLTVPSFRENCTGCIPNNRANVYTIISLGGILLSIAILFNIKCAKLPDVFGVFVEETHSANWVGLGFAVVLVISFAPVNQVFLFNILGGAALAAGFFVTTWLQIYIAKRQGGKIFMRASSLVADITGSNNKQNNTSNKPADSSIPSQSIPQSPTADHHGSIVHDIRDSCKNLHEILENPVLAKLFDVYTLREFCDENVHFLQVTYEWKKGYSDIARSASSARARKIVNTFIRETGLQQINIPSSIATKLLQFADDPSATFPESAFDAARIEIARMLEIGAVVRFMRTQEYINMGRNEAVVSAVSGLLSSEAPGSRV